MRKVHSTRPTWRFATVLLFGLVSAAANAASTTAAPTPAAHGAGTPPPAPVWVALTPSELREVLPPPPAPGSLADIADLDMVLLLQTLRTPRDEAEGNADAPRNAVQWATYVLGDHFDPACQTRAVHLLQTLHNDMRTANRAANAAWGERPRPAKADARVTPSLPNAVDGPGYPSARTAATRVFAEVLAELYPERRAELVSAAERSAMLRLIGGSHYPTDIAGGRYTAALFLRRLADVADYRDALREAREEQARCHAPRRDSP
jgi:acid phosphatase (class A)